MVQQGVSCSDSVEDNDHKNDIVCSPAVPPKLSFSVILHPYFIG